MNKTPIKAPTRNDDAQGLLSVFCFFSFFGARAGSGAALGCGEGSGRAAALVWRRGSAGRGSGSAGAGVMGVDVDLPLRRSASKLSDSNETIEVGVVIG